MRNQKTIVAAAALLVTWSILLLIQPTSGEIQAQGGDYDLSWWTVAAGGGSTGGGGYTLGGTIGQPDPGLLAGGEYTLGGGFWGGGALAGEHQVHLPLLLRNGP